MNAIHSGKYITASRSDLEKKLSSFLEADAAAAAS
jgi:hypothetical protein